MRESLTKILDRLSGYTTLIFSLVVSIGVLVLFLYCAFKINFFPRGLSLGDSLVFIFIAL